MSQICCRHNFPHFNQSNKPSGNKQNLCMQPQDVTHYSRRQCEGRWRMVASLLLAQILSCFLMFSIKFCWPSSLRDNVTVVIQCEMPTRIRLVIRAKLVCHWTPSSLSRRSCCNTKNGWHSGLIAINQIYGFGRKSSLSGVNHGWTPEWKLCFSSLCLLNCFPLQMNICLHLSGNYGSGGTSWCVMAQFLQCVSKCACQVLGYEPQRLRQMWHTFMSQK